MEADLDATCLERGWTPLMYAASKGNLVAVNGLLEAGCRVNQLSNPTGEGGLGRTVVPEYVSGGVVARAVGNGLKCSCLNVSLNCETR